MLLRDSLPCLVLAHDDAFHTEYLNSVLVLFQLQSCPRLCTSCCATLTTALMAALRPSAARRLAEQDFYGIRVDFGSGSAASVTTRHCSIALPLATVRRLLAYEDPAWWPALVAQAVDLLLPDDTASADADADAAAGTEWSLKLWYALDGVYTAEDALFRRRRRTEWEQKLARFLVALADTSNAACACPARRVAALRIPTSSSSAAWIDVPRQRRRVLRPLMADHAPGLACTRHTGGHGLDAAAAAMREREAFILEAREHMGRRGEWIAARMERWIADRGADAYLCGEMAGLGIEDDDDDDVDTGHTKMPPLAIECPLNLADDDAESGSTSHDVDHAEPAITSYPAGILRPIPTKPF